MKADLSHDLTALFYISRKSFKNHLRQIFESPLKAVMSVLKWVFYFVLIFSPMLILFVSRGMKKSSTLAGDFETAKPYIGGAVLLLLLLYVFYTLKKAIDDYKPTIFIAADANLVFSSPINRHTVYFFALVRSMFKNLMTAVMIVCMFLIFIFSFGINLVIGAIPLAILGLFSFGVFMQSFRFFINSLNRKLKSDKLTSFVFYIFLAAVALIVLQTVTSVKHDLPSIITALNAPSLEYIPFAGWAKGLVTGLVFENPNMVFFAVLYFLCAVASVVLSVFWADDYYEDAVTVLGETSELIEVAKTGRTDEVLAHSQRNKKQVKTTVSVRGTGAASFLWKSILLYKKNLLSKPVSNLIGYLFFFVVGVVIAVFLKSKDNSDYVFILLIIAFITSSVGASALNPVISELKHSYIFLLPGKLRHKLFYTVFQPILKFAVEFLLVSLPMLVAGRLSPIDFLSVYIVGATAGVLPVSGGVIITAIFPDDEALRKNPLMAMLKGFFLFIYYLPGGIVCALSLLLSWLLTHQLTMAVGFLGFAAGNLIAAFLMFFVSEKIFSRIEYKQ